MNVSEAVLRLRSTLGWSRERLAAEVEVTSMAITYWEKSLREPTDAHRVRLADIARDLGLSKLPRTAEAKTRKRWTVIIDALQPESFSKEARS